ncbi:MAG: class Ib ribonucleoside-diphosphate reductase assembly flavoprotein NrdI [Clostridia bacterium]|nr:class Ib ribonucleoside-diphosphate reductase assembly flavoprotein NrdI [Clostridia bacterium]
MKLIYASRTGNVQKLIDRLGVDALKIVKGDEKVEGEYLLVTYTDGKGIIPKAVDQFIANNPDGLKAAAVSGNQERHPDTFCGAAEKLEEKYGVTIVAKFDQAGDDATDAAIKAALE